MASYLTRRQLNYLSKANYKEAFADFTEFSTYFLNLCMDTRHRARVQYLTMNASAKKLLEMDQQPERRMRNNRFCQSYPQDV